MTPASYRSCALLLAALTGCSIEKNLLTVGEDTSSGTHASTHTSGDSQPTTGGETTIITGQTTTGESATGESSTTGPAITASSTDVSTTDVSTTDVSTTDVSTTGAPFDLGNNPGPDLGGRADEFASVDRTCAPNDGAAIEFRLQLTANVCGADALTDFRAALYQAAPLPAGSYSLADGGDWALFEGGQVVDSGNTGTIVIDAWDGDSVSFHYDLAGQTGTVVGAPFCDTKPMCG